jgi:diadenosine tetraphosphate (Ap4A) HIT family hydrolase
MIMSNNLLFNITGNSGMPECVFCAIVTSGAPASVVYADDVVLAIMDIRPVSAGHMLVLPRAHSRLLSDLDEAIGARMFVVAARVAAALRRCGVRCEGINLFLADGEAAGQEVPHAHLHVIPRFAGDSFRIAADWSMQPARDELEATAARIRRELAPF